MSGLVPARRIMMTKTIWTPSRRDLLRSTAAAGALGALGSPA
ncbi:MAG: twin-arginine translocation signal domain-containing protein, partial [Bosea sp. (in: a-proteobacteria)]